MGGQDGFSRDLLSYEEESSTLVAGIRVHPADTWELGLSLGWTDSQAELDPFGLPAPEYVATHPPTMFDFSRSHTYSTLDLSRFDGEIELKYNLREDIWLMLRHQLVDWEDGSPYLLDTNGTVQWTTLAAGWTF